MFGSAVRMVKSSVFMRFGRAICRHAFRAPGRLGAAREFLARTDAFARAWCAAGLARAGNARAPTPSRAQQN
eukprot:2537717-Pyramimonas_sp.AAC.1